MVRRKHDRFDHTSGGVVVIDRRIGGLGGLFSLSIPVDAALSAAAQAMARGADSGVAGGWALPPGFSAVLQPRSGTGAAAWYGGAGRRALSRDLAAFLGHARATQSPWGPWARRDVTRGGFHGRRGPRVCVPAGQALPGAKAHSACDLDRRNRGTPDHQPGGATHRGVGERG